MNLLQFPIKVYSFEKITRATPGSSLVLKYFHSNFLTLFCPCSMSTKYSTYVDNLYLKRLNDLEKPLPEDSPFFLPPRPIDTNPENGSGNQRQRAKGGRTFPPVRTAEERARQQLEYQESVKLPATTTLNEFPRFTQHPIVHHNS